MSNAKTNYDPNEYPNDKVRMYMIQELMKIARSAAKLKRENFSSQKRQLYIEICPFNESFYKDSIGTNFPFVYEGFKGRYVHFSY